MSATDTVLGGGYLIRGIFQRKIYLKNKSIDGNIPKNQRTTDTQMTDFFLFQFHLLSRTAEQLAYSLKIHYSFLSGGILRQYKVQEYILSFCFFLYRILRASIFKAFFPLRIAH